MGAARRPGGSLALATALFATLSAGCGATVPGQAVVAPVATSDRTLVHAYLDDLNAAGENGVDAQTAFLRATQEPGTPFPRGACLGQVTLRTRLVERTLRPDPDFVAPQVRGAPAHPAGAVYVVAVGVTASSGGVTVREQIGSKHVVVRDGRVYGYAPCPK